MPKGCQQQDLLSRSQWPFGVIGYDVGFKQIVLYLWIGLLLWTQSNFGACQAPDQRSDALSLRRHESQTLALARDPGWHRLLYFEPHIWGPQRSLVEDADFFLATNGHLDPSAELEASLAGFLLPLKPEQHPDQHPQCLMPARWQWLKERIKGWPPQTPNIHCPAYQTWRQRTGSGQVSLVFSSYFANNPASMFGHTFLVLKKNPGQASLLDQAISFVGIPDTENPFFYALRGVLGLFDGRLLMQPYYIKVQEYNNADRRDIWEYELQLSSEEIEQLHRVVWEIGPFSIPYRYFEQNCSTILMKILAAALPLRNLKLNHPWTIPSDTLRAVYRNPGMVSRITQRPSNLRQFLRRYRQLSPKLKHKVNRLVQENNKAALDLITPLSVKDQALVLDAVVDFADYEERLAGANTPKIFRELRLACLAARARLETPLMMIQASSAHGSNPEKAASLSSKDARDHQEANLMTRERPDQAPPSGRLGIGAGGTSLHYGFLEAEWRPALKDLASPSLGFSSGLAIEFFRLTGRLYQRVGVDRGIEGDENPGKRLIPVLSSFMFFAITSLPDLEPIVNSPAFNFEFGSETPPGCSTPSHGCLQTFLRGQRGISRVWNGTLVYAMVGGQLALASHEPVPYFGGPIATTGLLKDLGTLTRVGMKVVRSRQFGADTMTRDFDYGLLEWSRRLANDAELRFTAKIERQSASLWGGWYQYY